MRTLASRSIALVVTALVTTSACGRTPTITTPATTPAITPVTIGSSAVASALAQRVEPLGSECQRIATAISVARSSVDVQVIVRSDGWNGSDATVEVATRGSAGWACGAPMNARIGSAGFRPLLDRRSGDDTTPAGVFPLAIMTAPDGQRFSFFGNDPDPGVTAGTYRRVQVGDCFGATPGTSGYGHLRYDANCPGPDDEYLPRFVTTYSHAALIGANMEPTVSGDEPGELPYAAAIFLHRHTYVSGSSGPTKPTSGCVSLASADLTSVLLGLDAHSLFVIGPTNWLLTQM